MSSEYVQALMAEVEEHGESWPVPKNFYEITIASVDQPRLLSRLSEALVSFVLLQKGHLKPCLLLASQQSCLPFLFFKNADRHSCHQSVALGRLATVICKSLLHGPTYK